jgi:hypothetical protein
LNFRKKFGLNVLDILRRGKIYSTQLREMTLDFGDAPLLYGPKENINT